MSLEKCKFFTGSMSAKRVNDISNTLGFSVGVLPFKYLGVPIFRGNPRALHLQPIVDKIKGKPSAWKGSILSTARRVRLVNSIINGMMLIASIFIIGLCHC